MFQLSFFKTKRRKGAKGSVCCSHLLERRDLFEHNRVLNIRLDPGGERAARDGRAVDDLNRPKKRTGAVA